MKFGSVCSGIEAASMAWSMLGWEAAFFSEIEKFPSAVLAHHYPHVPNHGDMTQFKDWPDHAIDLLVGGTPCQSFSVAGLRAGLADPRGNLMLTYLAIAARYRPRWLVWENVPGVLSSADGRDFGTFLGALGELGYGFAYRVLDAQFCRAHGYERAVPQRRRRVFVVGYLGDWRRAAAVLFDGASLRGDPAPSRGQRKDVAPTISSRPTGGGGLGTDFDLDGGLVAKPVLAGGHANNPIDENLVPVAGAICKDSFSGGAGGRPEGAAVGHFVPVIAFGAQNSASQGDGVSSEIVSTLDKSKTPAVAHEVRPINTMVGLRHKALGERTGLGIGEDGDAAYTLSKAHSHAVQSGWAVRRLTPTECERLQGFPDNFTSVPYRGKPAADGPRYKALGNSMAVNVMRVIGTRIQMVETMTTPQPEQLSILDGAA